MRTMKLSSRTLYDGVCHGRLLWRAEKEIAMPGYNQEFHFHFRITFFVPKGSVGLFHADPGPSAIPMFQMALLHII